jgi:hypothetical protein
MMWSTDSDLRLVTFNNAFNEVVKGCRDQLGDSVIAEQFPRTGVTGIITSVHCAVEF